MGADNSTIPMKASCRTSTLRGSLDRKRRRDKLRKEKQGEGRWVENPLHPHGCCLSHLLQIPRLVTLLSLSPDDSHRWSDS